MEERIKKFLLSKAYKNPELLYKWFSQNRLYANFSLDYCPETLLTYDTFKIFMELCQSAQNIYEDDWDISIAPYVTNSGRIIFVIKGVIINFEEVEIKNRLGDSHIIRDLFILIALHQNHYNNIWISLLGDRLTVTNQELERGYRHSHLNGGARSEERFFENNTSYLIPLERFTNFCLGETILSSLVKNLHKQDNLVSDCNSLLLMLNTLVSWESLEGGPYIKFSEVYSSRTRSYFNSPLYIDEKDPFINKFYQDFVDSIYTNKEVSNLNLYTHIVQGINISTIKARNKDWIKDKLNTLCKEYLEDLENSGEDVLSFKLKYLIYKDKNGNRDYSWFVKPDFDESKKDIYTIKEGPYEYVFNGKIIKKKILIYNNIEVQDEEVIKRLEEELNNSVILNVTNKLEDEFNKKIIAKARNKKYFS